jgi:hypothetical protein
VCYDATGSITAGGAGGSFTIHSGGSSALVAGVKILLEPGVTVLSGGHLHGFVTQSGQYCQARSALKSGDTGAEGLSHGMPAYPGESSHVYPNPTTGYFTLEPAGVFRNMKLHAEIWSIHGQKVLSRDLAGSGSYGFSLGDTPCGLYILKIKGDKTAESIRLLKQD